MRQSGLALATLLVPFAPVAPASEMTTNHYAVVNQHDGLVDVALGCEGRAPDAASFTLSCDVYDAVHPPVHQQVETPGSPTVTVAVVVATDRVPPAMYCITATATYRDLSQRTTTQCGHLEG